MTPTLGDDFNTPAETAGELAGPRHGGGKSTTPEDVPSELGDESEDLAAVTDMVPVPGDIKGATSVGLKSAPSSGGGGLVT